MFLTVKVWFYSQVSIKRAGHTVSSQDFRSLSFTIFYLQSVPTLDFFFREISTFNYKLLSFNEFFSSIMNCFTKFFFLTFEMLPLAPECMEVYLERVLAFYLENLNPLRSFQDLPGF